MKITVEEGHSLDEMEIVIRCSRLVIKKLPYGLRVLIFAATMLTVLSAIAVSFEWFPADQLGQWIWLFAEFFISLLIVCLVSELRFRRKGNKYNKQLDKYRAKKTNSDT